MPVVTDLQIFYGKATDSLAYVYARMPSRAEWIKPRLVGTVRGPRADGVRTLPTTVQLVDLGPGESILARAIVPDPGFWSPDVPAVYDVEVVFHVTDIVRGSQGEACKLIETVSAIEQILDRGFGNRCSLVPNPFKLITSGKVFQTGVCDRIVVSLS